MRLRDVVLKRSLGRMHLHHIRSAYHVEINERALSAIEGALSSLDPAAAGRPLVDRLAARGLVEEGAFTPVPRREQSELVSLEIEPIGHCNLACKHCFVRFTRKTMTDATFAAVLQGACDLGAIELTLNGGEPLLHPRCLDWLAAVGDAGLRPLLFTNATLVTEAVAEGLARARVAKVTVSLDGFVGAHDALRGEGAFVAATAGIRLLVAAGLEVHTTTMVTPANHEDMADLKRFAREDLGVAAVRTSTIAPMGRAAQRRDLTLPDAEFQAVYASSPEPAARPADGLLPCRAGVDKLYVAANGDVHACHLFEAVAPPLGRLPDRPLAAIHAEVAGSRCGTLLRGFDPATLAGCAGCPALAECRGGCRARAWRIGGSAAAVDPIACARRGLQRAGGTAGEA